MQKVVIGSKNPVKIECVKRAFQSCFSNSEFEFIGVNVASSVSDQPMTDEETRAGAHNRAKNSMAELPEARYFVGVEGGLDQLDDQLYAFAWIVILRKDGKIGESRTSTFTLPEAVTKLIHQGVELGHADDQVFGRVNSKQSNGAVGLLTKDIVDRTTYYEQAVTLALIPFMNEGFY